ncbi:MAG: transporter substrate-binding domain-containing protein, partial [Desulfobacula sp.]|nr:transporter substrate-binding domain-containing protein [Desulfobacula sp.]
MKKIFFIICICLLSLISTGFSQEIIVRVPLGNTYPPFFIQDENNRWGGISIELAEILLKEADFKPVYKPLPFPRSLAYIRDGRIDLMLNLSITDKRKKFIYFIGPQLDETVVLVVKKDSDLKILCLDDIKKLPKPIGIERGKVYGPAFEKKRKEDK